MDINTIGPGGQTPLMHAVLSGKLKAVKALLKLGADTTIGEKDEQNSRKLRRIQQSYQTFESPCKNFTRRQVLNCHRPLSLPI